MGRGSPGLGDRSLGDLAPGRLGASFPFFTVRETKAGKKGSDDPRAPCQVRQFPSFQAQCCPPPFVRLPPRCRAVVSWS